MRIFLTAFLFLFGVVVNAAACNVGDAAVHYDAAGDLTKATWSEPVNLGVLLDRGILREIR